MAVEHVVFVAGVFIGQGHEQGLPDFTGSRAGSA